MAEQMGTQRATWFVIGIVILGVVAVTSLSGRGGFGSASASDRQHMLAILGSVRRVAEPRAFSGADASAVMGSCDLDLTHAQLSAGAEAVVDIFAMMGSVTIRVPNGWTIDTRAIPVMGGVRDDRWPEGTTDAEPGAAAAANPPHLVLRGFVMMGSIIIKS